MCVSAMNYSSILGISLSENMFKFLTILPDFDLAILYLLSDEAL